MLRSVKNLSDELGVEKFRIYKFIKDNDLRVTHLGSSKVMYFDDSEAEKIIRAFTPEASRSARTGEPSPNNPSAPYQPAGPSASMPNNPSAPYQPAGPSASMPNNPSVPYQPAGPSASMPNNLSAPRQPAGSDAPASSDSPVNASVYEDMLLQLRRELDAKDQQIEAMNSQLTNMTGALRNANDCIRRLSEGTRNLTESLRASQAMYLSAVQSISEEQEKTRLLQGRIAEAAADREAAQKEAAESAASVRKAAQPRGIRASLFRKLFRR